MDDQDWINLQKLAGRPPQRPLGAPETPYSDLLAEALRSYGQTPPASSPTFDPQVLADALQAYGRQPPVSDASSMPDNGADAASAGASAYTMPASAAVPAGPPSNALPDQQAPADPGTLYAMGSPANVDQPWQTMADRYAEPPPKPKPAPAPTPPTPSAIQTTIDPIPGFDETGDNAWRKANDQIFLDAVNRYNAANGYRPGDPGYWTADMLKAQAMVESGSNRQAFITDPLQVNTRANWADEKKAVAGLTQDQAMTPQISADAALKWLGYKGWGRDNNGQRAYFGDSYALRNYMGDRRPRSHFTREPWDQGVSQRDWYAIKVPQLAQEAAAARASQPRTPR